MSVPVSQGFRTDRYGLAEWSAAPWACGSETIAPPGFRAVVRSRWHAGVGLADTRADAHEQRRTEERIAADDAHDYAVVLMLEGGSVVSQGDAVAALAAGEWAILDVTRPFTWRHPTASRALRMRFPHSMVPAPSPIVGAVTATRFGAGDGLGRLALPLLRHLADGLAELRGGVGARVAHSAVDLIGATLVERVGAARDDARPAPAQFLACCEIVAARLADPGLGPEAIATAAFISTRQVHKLFHAQRTTVSRHIRERRLEQCRLALADPENAGSTVSEIGARFGLCDSAHFSRLFRAAYGTSPSEYRRLVVSGLSAESVPA